MDRRIARNTVQRPKIVEIESMELISERAITWLKISGFFLGIPAVMVIAFLSFLGVKTYRNIEYPRYAASATPQE
jgi:hypothetical protein